VRVIYGNDNAASMQPGEPLPYGSILVMETYRALVKEGRVILDEKGRFQRMGDPTGVFVMRKEMGFGEAYRQNRTGEWEYVAYRPDGSFLTAGGPRDSGACAQCHLQATSAKDWVFRASLYLNEASGALPNSLMQHYLFLPGTIQAQAGVPITWYNDDEVDHRIVLDTGGFDSGNLSQGTSTSYTFDQPGEYDYHCTIHPAMKGKVVVKGDK
jgi:plastocyanin